MKLQLPPEPLNKGLLPPDPCPLSSTEFVEPTLRTKFLGMPLKGMMVVITGVELFSVVAKCGVPN